MILKTVTKELEIKSISIFSRLKRFFLIKNSVVKKNFLSLSILQIANYIFPLITLPYITRIFGPELYGLINFASSLIAYFTLIVNYGFNLSASRDIAQNRDNWEKVEKIFNNVLSSKVLLFFVSALVFLVTVFSVAKINQYKVLYLIMFLEVGGNVFFPTWFFQGIEKLNLTAIFTFIIRLIFTLLVFLLIKSKDDFLLYPVTTLVGQIIVAIISLWIIHKTYKINIKFAGIDEIWKTLKNDAKIFYTTIVINLYSTTNLVLLGFLGSNEQVGIFSAAYKMIYFSMAIFSTPFSNSLFPNISSDYNHSIEIVLKKIKKSLVVGLPISFMITITFYYFAGSLITTMFGNKFMEATKLLKILSIMPTIIFITNIFYLNGLINMRKDRIALLITTTAGILNIILNIIFIPIYHTYAVAYIWVLIEFMIMIASILFFVHFIKIKYNMNLASIIKVFGK